ncbi:MAG: hypothetical protein Q4A15_01235 [Prevotellaceae bacterium]|nr:hypothetical protein [Prevotellaceae bacterium]
MGKILIDDGVEEFELCNRQGKTLGKIYFNPSDLSLPMRYQEVADNFDKIFDDESLKEMSEKELGETLKSKICEQFDYLFNTEGMAEEIFSITNPFSPVGNGELFIQNVMGAIAEVIRERTGKRMKQIQKNISKWTDKYHG